MFKDIVKKNEENWKSPVSAQFISKKSVQFGDLHWDQGKLYWTESRPELGRSFVVSCDFRANLVQRDETSSQFHVTGGVHGYGGGAFFVRDGRIYFYDGLTKQVYCKDLAKETISKLTSNSDTESVYGDFHVDKFHKYLYCLKQTQQKNKRFPTTEIVRVEIASKLQEVVAIGSDFYSNIRLSPDSTKLCYLQWNYPHMPWDENELWTAQINKDFHIQNQQKFFHKSGVSLYQPEWDEGNRLYAACELADKAQFGEISINEFTSLFSCSEVEFSRPLWIAGTRVFSFLGQGKILLTGCEDGIWKTFLFDKETKIGSEIKNNLSCIQNMSACSDGIAYIGGNEKLGLSIFYSSCESPEKIHTLKSAFDFSSFAQYLSLPKRLEFFVQKRKVFAFYYPPTNPDYKLLEPPPCILKIHGGPTTSAEQILNPKVQFFTSRGFAYVEINYNGSSGFGKNYRNQLNGNWGVVDVEDCIGCAEFLIENNLAHGKKLILSGGSAGGFTLLNTLAKTLLFQCASCFYGVSDLLGLAEHIHKFEACYDQNLVGDTIENNADLYLERSPISKVQSIQTPLLFFHGDKDPVVHHSQTLKMADCLQKHSVACEVVILENEGHGFKKEENIVFIAQKELEFYEKHLQ